MNENLSKIHAYLAAVSTWIFLLSLSSSVAGFDYFQVLPIDPLIPTDSVQSDEIIQLGKRLFYDKQLSQKNSHSCNDCHNLLSGGDSDSAFTMGPNGKFSTRSAPGLWNIGLQTVLYWDGRSKSLEHQFVDHLQNKNIMGIVDVNKLAKQIIADYKPHFKNAFGDIKVFSIKHIAQALSAFERALMALHSAFDQYLSGDKQAMSANAVEGMKLFNNVGCLACHFGATFSGPAPGPALDIGEGFYELFPNHLNTKYNKQYRLTDDLGRYHFSKDPNEKHLWRVPPLRNIALTAPYFHNGSAKTLREAIRVMAKTQLLKDLTEKQIDKLEAFLNSLTGELPEILRNTKH